MSDKQSNDAADGKFGLFGNLKVKNKVLGGFAPVLGVLTLVGGTGYWSLSQGNAQFSTYTQRVRVQAMASEIEKDILDLRRNAREYGYSGNGDRLAKAREIAAETKGEVERARTEVTDTERRQKMQGIAAALDGWLAAFEKMAALKGEQADIIKTDLDRIGPAIADALEALAGKAAQGGSSDLSFLSNQALLHVMQARLYVNMALGRHDAEIANKAAKTFDALDKDIRQMSDAAAAAAFKAELDQVAALVATYHDAALRAEQNDSAILELLSGTMLDSGTRISEDAKAIRDSAEADASAIGLELDAMMSTSRDLMLIVALAGLAVGGVLAWLLGGAIGRPVVGMAEAMKKIADSDFNVSVPGLGRKDEIGAMAGALATLREASIEAARAKSSLEGVSTNVMVADAEGKIVFMNKTMTAMLKNAEADIRKDLPRFDASNLIGRSFDEFHKSPVHQRGLLANLAGPYRTQIKVGRRRFGLSANPTLNNRGERVGTSVEWADMTQDLAVQEEVAQLVSAVAAGDLSKRLGIEGKVGFMKTLAEGINQVTETVNKAVSEIVTMMSAMAQGDLSQRISGEYQGEFLKLKTDANATAEKLSEIVGQTVERMANIKSSTTEIASGATDLSSRTEEQVASLEEIAASIRLLNTTVQQSAENAGQASQLAMAARTSAEGGGEVAGAAVKAMGEIEQSSQKISDIVGMIDEIAFQTSLLALNAAVEAARAGEAGRGFAVVAGEVRALAQRSSHASKEIKTLISNSNGQVKQGVGLVNKAGATLGEIVTSVKRVSDIVAEIAAANKEQSASVGEVQEAIGQIEQATQQNASLVEETTAALGSADNQVQGVTDVISFFKSDAAPTAKPALTRSPAKGAKAVQAKLTAKVAKPSVGPTQSSGGKKLAATGTDDGWEEF